LLLFIFLSPAALGEEEIAVLTIRRDNIHKTTKSELVPIAKVEHGQFRAIAGVEDPEHGVCAPKTFRGWAQPGVAYDVLHRGNVIGTATSTRQERGAYSCSELCVVRTVTSLREQAPGIRSQRRGFDPSGTFDESITQYVAYAAAEGKQPYSTRITVPLTSADSTALRAYAKARMLGEGKASTRRVSMGSVEPFIGSKAGEVNIFVSAVIKRPKGTLRVISAVVKRADDGTFNSMFELLEDGDEDRGAASYEFMDAVDFDGDGIAELFVVYHNYEFHEFQILKRIGSKFEVVHKGPTYGC
jgi:hypothetical protein